MLIEKQRKCCLSIDNTPLSGHLSRHVCYTSQEDVRRSRQLSATYEGFTAENTMASNNSVTPENKSAY